MCGLESDSFILLILSKLFEKANTKNGDKLRVQFVPVAIRFGHPDTATHQIKLMSLEAMKCAVSTTENTSPGVFNARKVVNVYC